MAKKIITISREYGSGGHEIGEKLAAEIGYSFYDRELITKVAERTTFSESFLSSYNEKLKGMVQIGSFFTGDSFISESIVKAEKEIICEIAEKGNCIIVGRCAEEYLREWDSVLKVFVQSSMTDRRKRIATINDCSLDEAEAKIRKIEKNRKAYYQYCTNKDWGKRTNYDLVLNSATVGIDKCVEILKNIVK